MCIYLGFAATSFVTTILQAMNPNDFIMDLSLYIFFINIIKRLFNIFSIKNRASFLLAPFRLQSFALYGGETPIMSFALYRGETLIMSFALYGGETPIDL